MTSGNPFGQRPDKSKPKIWAEGGQRPPFEVGATARATLHLSREAVAPLHAWAARTARRVAVNVKNGAGRIPADKLGRAARFVPSHMRVAGWIKNFGAILSHASANADPNIKRGNALVAEIEPHLWTEAEISALAHPPMPAPAPTAQPDVAPAAEEPQPPPVVLPEPMQPDDDPLASIRDEMDGKAAPARRTRLSWPAEADLGPAMPPAPPGPLATAAIQVSGYLIGWATAIIALPYGLIRALWLYFAKSVDLRGIRSED
jgi:hypothetical protein